MTYDDLFTALADPTRRNIFEGLRQGPMTVTALAQQHPVSRPAVSQHLKVLREAGLVSVSANGTRRFYSIRHQGLALLRGYLDQFWTDALASYQTEIERQFGDKNA